MSKFINVFVLCTGRCGSLTFAKACGHMTNYTAGHETQCHEIGWPRIVYPTYHIEVDNRLAWFLGRLDEHYGDKAFYVHLMRPPLAVAMSYANRYDFGIMKAYRGAGILKGLYKGPAPFAVALDYCETVNANIELFLKDKTHKMSFYLENYRQDFPRFWEKIAALGDQDLALREFGIKHNASVR